MTCYVNDLFQDLDRWEGWEKLLFFALDVQLKSFLSSPLKGLFVFAFLNGRSGVSQCLVLDYTSRIRQVNLLKIDLRDRIQEINHLHGFRHSIIQQLNIMPTLAMLMNFVIAAHRVDSR